MSNDACALLSFFGIMSIPRVFSIIIMISITASGISTRRNNPTTDISIIVVQLFSLSFRHSDRRFCFSSCLRRLWALFIASINNRFRRTSVIHGTKCIHTTRIHQYTLKYHCSYLLTKVENSCWQPMTVCGGLTSDTVVTGVMFHSKNLHRCRTVETIYIPTIVLTEFVMVQSVRARIE